jgi:hypothetical protein
LRVGRWAEEREDVSRMIANALSKGDRCIRGGAAAPQVKGASRLRWHGEKKTSLWQRSGKAITTVLRRASICEGLITDSLPARGGSPCR